MDRDELKRILTYLQAELNAAHAGLHHDIQTKNNQDLNNIVLQANQIFVLTDVVAKLKTLLK